MSEGGYEVLSEADGYRVIQEETRYEELLPLVPTAPTLNRVTIYRIQAQDDCRECQRHRCVCEDRWDTEEWVWATEVRVEVRNPNTDHDPAVRIYIGDDSRDRHYSGATRDHRVLRLLSDLLREITSEVLPNDQRYAGSK